ncbi:unnamed protein product, partial [Rotaria socialis]
NVQNKSDNHHNVSSHGSHHPLQPSTHHAPTGIYVNTRPMVSSFDKHYVVVAVVFVSLVDNVEQQ